ncbi:pentatricopeptide repeat-containing protein At3g14330-like [Cryptomeria japonica]|uniref:pentatricopeptide repeat-containing protein At3g14330-like n=1 Tax=Cryptomeria japonica TaxID=3369 RepID=UPI0025AB8937|nr:pentatricopeptide repeat-containing protein At3g14330-like [Cryptomeria japonica]
MSQRANVSWSVMIAGMHKMVWDDEVLQTFQEMREAVLEASSRTFAIVLSGCAKLAALEESIQNHGEMIRSRIQYEIPVLNSLIDMCAKCRSFDNARQVLDKMDHPDVSSWTSILS